MTAQIRWKKKKELHSWDWIPQWDNNAAISEDLQEPGKCNVGQQPQKLMQRYLRMLEGGEYTFIQD